MPRDASGNYTLPAGNPVVTGTTIDSSWANDTMDDIKTVLTDSLSRSGDGGMLVAFENASGTVGAPGMTWTSEPTSGFYLAAANDMRVSIAGSVRARFRADANDPFQIWVGGAWSNLLNTGSNYTITGTWTLPSGTIIDGITASNLVDKSAAETIAGAWSFTGVADFTTGATFTVNLADIILTGAMAFTGVITQVGDVGITGVITQVGDVGITGALTATSYGGITEANLVGKSSAETISGAWTFTGIPILDAPVTVADYGTGGRVKDGTDTARPIGFNTMPVYEVDVSDTFDLAHNGMYWHKDSGAATAITLDNDADIPQGATFVLSNEDADAITITQGSGVTIKHFDGSGAPPTGNLTLAQGGVATVYKYSDTVYHVWGNAGLS
jgi:hypothetical protein